MVNASIVIYKHGTEEIIPLIETLRNSKNVATIYIIDNSPTETLGFNQTPVKYVFTKRNIGYGSAHNIALKESINDNIPYHLVINPDIKFETNIIEEIEIYMNAHKDIGNLMPKVIYPDGNTQYVCKLLPTPIDLLIRRFIPLKIFSQRIKRFELRFSGYNSIMNVPYLSGCFMFLRTDTLKQIGLFDERFFMYPEDIDLSRRINEHFRNVFYPECTIVHEHGRASYQNIKMLLIHTINIIKYFNKWGWFIDNKRKELNKKTLYLLQEKNNSSKNKGYET